MWHEISILALIPCLNAKKIMTTEAMIKKEVLNIVKYNYNVHTI